MIYSDLISQVCAEVGKTDTATVTIARAAARRWAQQIWARYDWRESQILFYQTVAANTTVLCLPPIVERIIECRMDTSTVLQANEMGAWFQIDSSMFEMQGFSYGLAEIAAIATVIPTPGEKLVLTANNAGDTGVIAFIRGDSAGLEIHETIALGVSPVTSANTYDIIYEVSKPNTTLGSVTLTSGTSATALGTIQAYESERKYLRLQLMGSSATTGTTTALVLAKRRCPIIHTDNQSTPLRNMDLAMMSLVTMSVWNYVRQKADAAAEMTTFGSLVQTMIDLEVAQSGIQKRIIPSDSYGSRWSTGYDHLDPLGQIGGYY